MSDLVSFVTTLEAQLLNEEGGRFHVTLRRSSQDGATHANVFAPGKHEFIFDPTTVSDRHTSRNFNWSSALAQIARIGYGEIEVEITKSGKRMVTERRVTTSFRSL